MSAELVAVNGGPVIERSREEIDLIKKTVAVGASDLDLKLFLYQCARTGLDPLIRQIYWIKRGDKGTIQVGIDGYRLIADRTGRYAGNDAPVFEMTEGCPFPVSATVTVWKLVGATRCPFTATALWQEYYPGDGAQGQMWRKRPFGQLGKCAEALALRKAFPAELSGMYTQDEMDQADGHEVHSVTHDAPQQRTPPTPEEITAAFDAKCKALGYKGSRKAVCVELLGVAFDVTLDSEMLARALDCPEGGWKAATAKLIAEKAAKTKALDAEADSYVRAMTPDETDPFADE